ncbi:peptidoglycan-binding domain-containing protein [Reinekea marinisedimentorum]|uniref:Putative peptidoglycan binding protein n=1 Tax=Reinekea marinisedimentorum TaxID=230495 RepID=A0A4R3IC89_9GAMM|nr:peptidoglycan-binding domain-containing protein [Reinekea marinisedimentorum]TCS42997.1 putative peptidoglycan binding protein [Reinekea marinisedimentorum]
MSIGKTAGQLLPALCLVAFTASCAQNPQPEQVAQPDCSIEIESEYCKAMKTDAAEPMIDKAEELAEEASYELKKNYTNVKDLQQALTRHCSGLDKSFIDGQPGPHTQNMLIRFQQAYGLTADGIVGAETTEALNGLVSGKCEAI